MKENMYEMYIYLIFVKRKILQKLWKDRESIFTLFATKQRKVPFK